MRGQKTPTLLFLLGIFGSATASAQGDPLVFMDVFGGYAWNDNQDVQARTSIAGTPANIHLDNLDVEHGPTFGGRIGMWLQSNPNFGIAIDATRFDSDIDRQTARVDQVSPAFTGSRNIGVGDIRIANVLATFDLIIRHRGERFTPYVLAGPGILFSSIDDSDGGFALQNDDNDVSFGYKAGAGVSYKVSDTMHLFTEYRYLHGSPEYEANTTDVFTVPPATVNTDIEMDIDTHMVVGGLSIRF